MVCSFCMVHVHCDSCTIRHPESRAALRREPAVLQPSVMQTYPEYSTLQTTGLISYLNALLPELLT